MQYNRKSNEYTGFCHEIGQNGLPHSTFKANDVQDISNYYEHFDKSSYLYVVMAVALDPSKKSPSFCLAAWGTNQKFTAAQVDKRLKITISELEKFGIEVLGFSGDGDSRILKVQRQYSGLGDVSYMNEYFFSKLGTAPLFCIQDLLHIVGKIGNRALKLSFPLKIGKTIIPLKSDLKLLIKNVPRVVHGLCESDLDNNDKMNKTKKIKMCHVRVDVALREMSNKDTQATRLFLRLMRCVYEPFDKQDLTVKERIGLSWYATFILRGWKAFNTSQEFLTDNAYICQEINCHNLVMLVQYLRNTSNTESFIPSKMNSQTCESFFRRLRAFTTSELTQTNFDVKEAMNRIDKIMLLEESELHMQNIGIVFPDAKDKQNPSQKAKPVELPSDLEIQKIIRDVKTKAIAHLEHFGVELDNESLPCLVKSTEILDDGEDDEEDGSDENEPQNENSHDLHIEQIEGIVQHCEPGTSKFQMTDSQGQTVCVNKSTHLWSLGDSVPVPSVDRRYRFFTKKKNVNLPSNEDHVHLNDWIHFKNIPYVCRVLDFRKTTNLSQKKIKDVTISKEFVRISGDKEIGLYCSLYRLLDDGTFVQMNHINSLIPLKNFKNHLPCPLYPGPKYDQSTCNFVKEQIYNYQPNDDDKETSMEIDQIETFPESEENEISMETEQNETYTTSNEKSIKYIDNRKQPRKQQPTQNKPLTQQELFNLECEEGETMFDEILPQLQLDEEELTTLLSTHYEYLLKLVNATSSLHFLKVSKIII